MTIGATFDEVLVAAQAGGEWAFSVLYRDINPLLVRYFYARAPHAAEDLASEVWLGAAKGLASFAGDEAAFRGWLFTIARRRLIEHWRHQGRRPSVAVPDETLDAQLAPDDPEASALSSVSAVQAAAAIAAVLPESQAEVVLLRILGGLDVDQVAGVLGKRPGTVRVLQHKALRRLAERFPEKALTP